MVTLSKIPGEITGRWKGLVQQADDWLHQELGRWGHSKTIDWRAINEASDEPSFDVLISEGGVSVSDRFDRFELANERLFRARIRELWRKLINGTTLAQTERLTRMLHEWEQEAVVGPD